ncbi:MAG: MFS transporter [Chloroflexota bacterium]
MSVLYTKDQGMGGSQTKRYLWVVLPLVFGAVMAQGLVAQGIPVLYPFIQDEFALSRAQVGLITSAYAIGFGAAVIVTGWLTDVLGAKRMVIIACFTLAAFTLAFPLAYSFSYILALVVLIGIVSSPLYPASTRGVMDWFPGRIRASAMSIKQAGYTVGGFLAAALLPVIALAIGWRLAAAATGLLVVTVAIAFVFFYRDAPSGGNERRKFNLSIIKVMLRNRPLMMTMLWGAVFGGLQYVVLTYYMLFVIEKLQLSVVLAGGLLAIIQISSGVSRILSGAASDFLFRGRRLPVLVLMGLVTVLWALGASTMNAGTPGSFVYLVAVLIGVSTMASPGVLTTLLGEQADTGQVGTTIGVFGTVLHIFQMSLPPLFGYLVDVSDSYSLAWRVVSLVALACTMLLLAFGRGQKRV